MREKVLEHLLLGQLGVELLSRQIEFSVLRAVDDRHGYDVIIETNNVTRHIQLKSSTAGSTTRVSPINIRLASKPSGCVIWMVFDPALKSFAQLRWFGGLPGAPLPDLGERAVRHSRGNAQGVKAVRPGMRSLSAGRFENLADMKILADRLFGASDQNSDD